MQMHVQVHAASVREQFMLDAPRITMVLDGRVCRDAPSVLLCRLLNEYANGDTMVYWCTQTALADVYARKLASIQRAASRILACVYGPSATANGAMLHLVDDGKQVNTFRSHSLVIEKPFRLCALHSNGDMHTLRALQMFVCVGDDSRYTVHWSAHAPDNIARGTTGPEITGSTVYDAIANNNRANNPNHDANHALNHDANHDHLDEDEYVMIGGSIDIEKWRRTPPETNTMVASSEAPSDASTLSIITAIGVALMFL